MGNKITLEEIFLKDGKFIDSRGNKIKNSIYCGSISRCGELTKLNNLNLRAIAEKSKREFSKDFNAYLVEESTMDPGLLAGVCSKFFNYNLKFYKI